MSLPISLRPTLISHFFLHLVTSFESAVTLLSLYISMRYYLVTSFPCTINNIVTFVLSIFLCPLTSIFQILITPSSSVFLSTYPNHISLASLIVNPMFIKPALALISSVLIFSILFYSHYPSCTVLPLYLFPSHVIRMHCPSHISLHQFCIIIHCSFSFDWIIMHNPFHLNPLSQWLFRVSVVRTSERNVTSRSLIAFTVRS